MLSATSLIILLSLFGIGVAFFYMKKVIDVPIDLGLNKEESDKLKVIHGAIAEGAMILAKGYRPNDGPTNQILVYIRSP